MSKPHAFVALYSGETIGAAKIIAASADPGLVSIAAERMLEEAEGNSVGDGDPVSTAINQGRRNALRLITQEEAADHA